MINIMGTEKASPLRGNIQTENFDDLLAQYDGKPEVQKLLKQAREALNDLPDRPRAAYADKVLKPLIDAEMAALGKIEADESKAWQPRTVILASMLEKYSGRDLHHARQRWSVLTGVIPSTPKTDMAETVAVASKKVTELRPPEEPEENPYKDLNPADPRLKKLTSDQRLRLKKLSSAELFAMIGVKPLPYEKAKLRVKAWESIPVDLQIYELFSGLIAAKTNVVLINDITDTINQKWKVWKKGLLTDCLAVVSHVCDGRDRQKDNKPEELHEGACLITAHHHEQIEFARTAMERAAGEKPTVFRFGTELALIQRIPEEGIVQAAIVNKDGLRGHLNKVAPYARVDKEGVMQIVAAPMDVVSDLFTANDLPLPYLIQVTNYPVFDKAGEWLATDAYHPSAYVVLELPPDLTIPGVSPQPTKEEVREALRLLIEEYLGDFPFDGYTRHEILVACGLADPMPDEEARPVPPSLLSFLAFLLQSFVRHLIGRSPMPALLITKPAAGSGATKLADTAQIIVKGSTGTRPAIPVSEEERRKTIFAALRGGSPFIFFDNVTGALDSPVMAALLTSVTFTDRVLGRSEERSIPNNASVVITGNNPTLSRELQRRVSLCRLDAGVAEPDKRADFKHSDLEGWVADNRGVLIWALATLVRNWIAKGEEAPSGASLASYGPWYLVCGGVLEAAGLKGFQSNRDQIAQIAGADEEDPIHLLVSLWFSALPLANQYAGGDEGLAAFCDMHDIMLPVKRRMINGEAKYDATALGSFLASYADRVFECDGETLTLKAGKKTKHGKPWSLIVKPEKAAD